MKNLNNTAFSLLEILLASIIFIISIGGIFATLSAVRVPVANKENALSAAVYGKQVLETLRSSVTTQSTAFYNICGAFCATFDLGLGPHSITPMPLNPSADVLAANNNTLTYTVSCADGSAAGACGADVARRVDLNVSW